MFYTIYKTTNLINGKYYIGKHQTKNLDDGYSGSGKLLKRAIKKYGAENFVTEILHIFDEEWKMNLAERILVVPDVEISYNLCPGGQGGFGFINKTRTDDVTLKNAKLGFAAMVSKGANFGTGSIHSEEAKKKISEAKKKLTSEQNAFYGKAHSEEWRKDHSNRMKGCIPPNLGMKMIHNKELKVNKTVKPSEVGGFLSIGWERGRFKFV